MWGATRMQQSIEPVLILNGLPYPPIKTTQFHHQLRFSNSSPKLKPFRFSKSLSMSLLSAMEPQKMTVLNDQNEKLVGLLHDTGSKEIVIVCHGFRSSKEQRLIVSHSIALENEGISAFRFDFSGNGESDGSFAYGNYMKEVEDLCSVVKYFKDANRDVSAIVGHSKGGDVVLLYASKYHDVRTVVNLSGRYDVKKGISERLGDNFMEILKKDGYIDVKSEKTGETMYRVTLESLVERLRTDMHEASLKIPEQCRVLTVHGSVDDIIPVEDAYEFAKVIPNHKLHIIEGANHGYTKYVDQLVPVVLDFIKTCPKQDKEIPT